MAIGYLIKVNSVDLTPYLNNYEVSYEEMWTEANRNMAGNLKATYIGTVPKITMGFRHLTSTEMGTVLDLLNAHTFTVSWWNEDTGTNVSGSFYRGELKIGIRDIASNMYKDMTVNLIAFNTI